MRQTADRVLSQLTASELWAQAKFPSPDGCVNKEGLAKLADHPDVEGVGLDVRFRIPDVRKARP